jgi:hypothetical protein
VSNFRESEVPGISRSVRGASTVNTEEVNR